MREAKLCMLLLIIHFSQGLPSGNKINNRIAPWMSITQGAGILDDSDVNAINNLALKNENSKDDIAPDDNDYIDSSQQHIVPRYAENKSGFYHKREIIEPILKHKLPQPVSTNGDTSLQPMKALAPLQHALIQDSTKQNGINTPNQSDLGQKPIVPNDAGILPNWTPDQLANTPLDQFPIRQIDIYRNLPSILYTDTLDDDHFKLLQSLNIRPLLSSPPSSQFSSDFSSADDFVEQEKVPLHFSVPNIKQSRLPDEIYGTKFKPVKVSQTVYVNHLFPSGGGGFMFPVRGPKSVFGYSRSARFLGHFLHN